MQLTRMCGPRHLYFFVLLCLGCSANEVAILPEADWNYLTTSDVLASNSISCIEKDKSGRMWFGHPDAGISVYDGSSFVIYNMSDGLNTNAVNDVLENSYDEILAATDDGLNYFVGNTWGTVPYFSGIPINCMVQTGNEVLWFGTEGYGIFYLLNGNFIQHFFNTCNNCNYVYDMLQSQDGALLLATSGGLVSITSQTIEVYTTADGLSTNELSSLAEDEWGNLWIGSAEEANIMRFYQGDFETIELNLGPALGWVTCLQAGSKGELWVGTRLFGLVGYDGLVSRRVYEGLPDEYVTTALNDGESLWIGTRTKGVSRFNP